MDELEIHRRCGAVPSSRRCDDAVALENVKARYPRQGRRG